MKKIAILFLLLITIIKIHSQESTIVPGNIIVVLSSLNDADQLSHELSYINDVPTHLKISKVLSKSMHICLFEFDASAIDKEKMLNAIKMNRLVKIAQFNHKIQERIVPNDTDFLMMWNMDNTGPNGGIGSLADADIDAPEAWNITTGGITTEGDSIVVAVIDGGFSLTHPDLNFWKNYAEIPNDTIDNDNNGYVDDYDGWNSQAENDNWPPQAHGTHISGIIGAKGNNGTGVAGINWNIKVLPVSYGNANSAAAFEAGAIAAYSYVFDQRSLYNQTNGTKGAFIVATNSSFGLDNEHPADHPIWCAMYDSLGSVGILNAGATSNLNTNVDVMGDIPTECTSNWLVTITSTRSNDTKSNAGYGAISIDMGAPGVNIQSTYYNGSNNYSSQSGTSMAAPHIAGTIGLMYSVACSQFITDYKANPAAIALVVKDSLLNATDSVPGLSGITVTSGRLNLFNSVKAIQNYCSVSTTTNIINKIVNNNFEIKNVYPNPASNLLNIEYNSNSDVDIYIMNLVGQKIKTIHNTFSSKGIQHVRVELDSLSKGIYFISMSNGSENSNVVKVVIH